MLNGGIIYLITNQVTGKYYVGQTARAVEKRFKVHCDCSKGEPRLPLHRSIRKHGQQSFMIEPLSDRIFGKQKVDDLERLWIILLRSRDKNYGYNVAPGGEGLSSDAWTPELRKRLSEAHAGKILTDSHKEKIGKASRGRKHSEETKVKIGAGWRGKNHSEESKEKDRQAHLGKKASEETRKIMSTAQRKRYQEHPVSEETRKKISQIHSGREISEETRKKISESNKGRQAPNKGKSPSPETVAKMEFSSHLRWHVKHGIVNPNCKFCVEGV